MGPQTLKNIQIKFLLALTIEALSVVVIFINEFTEAEDESLEVLIHEIDRVSSYCALDPALTEAINVLDTKYLMLSQLDFCDEARCLMDTFIQSRLIDVIMVDSWSTHSHLHFMQIQKQHLQRFWKQMQNMRQIAGYESQPYYFTSSTRSENQTAASGMPSFSRGLPRPAALGSLV